LLASIALLAGGLVLVVAGAEMFFKGLLALAARMEVSAFALAVVISGLEVENLAAGIAANAKGFPDAAAGTFLGGSTFLALGVAGLGALVAPMRARIPAGVLAWTAVSPLPLVALSLDGQFSRVDGVLLLAWFAVAMVGLVRAGRPLLGEALPERRRHPLARVVGGLALLSIGGELLGEGIRKAVSRFDISQALLGNTAIAASVEAEEVARVAVPARRGRPDVGIGNIAGTIVHFISLNAGVIALVKPLELGHASVRLHLPVAAGAAATFCALVWLRQGLGRGEGAALVLLYLVYVAVAIVVG
jgi:cation:H+ antiporter